MYLPALALGAARVIAIVRGSEGALPGPLFSRVLDTLDRLEPVYLFVCAIAALGVLVRAFREITSVTARRQLRWIAWGTALGVGPFAVGYALPWALGANPPLALQLTAIPLGLVPLDVRVGDLPLSPARRRSHHQARPGVHGVPRRQRHAVCRYAQGHRLRVSTRRRRAQLDHRAARDADRRAAGAAGEGRRAERARSRVLPRSLRLPSRARRLRARPEHRPRRRAHRPAARRAHCRNARRGPHGADAGAGG